MDMEDLKADAETAIEARRGGRPAAGTDPQKRRQIMEGAGRVFSTLGFDAASMSDVAREAEVSKATLYVYFQNKEQLFAAICAERRNRNISELSALLDVEKPIDVALSEFGSEALRRLSQPFVVAAHRIVIGVAERLPEIGREFYEAGPQRLALALADFIVHHVKAGRLKTDDPYLAAVQLLELGQATIFRPRLYATVQEPASEEEISRVISSAVRMFLATYGTSQRSG
jgi:TetR/AcrR family transcriptional regulator of autoinduction and epiphytic fitness